MSNVIGRLSVGGEPLVDLTASGEWVPVDGGDNLAAAQAALLNARFDPRHPEAGDHQLGFGFAAMYRARDSVRGATLEVLAKPDPLPAGAVA
jgi:hypothetical protein